MILILSLLCSRHLTAFLIGKSIFRNRFVSVWSIVTTAFPKPWPANDSSPGMNEKLVFLSSAPLLHFTFHSALILVFIYPIGSPPRLHLLAMKFMGWPATDFASLADKLMERICLVSSVNMVASDLLQSILSETFFKS